LPRACSVVAHTRRPPPLAFTVSRIQRLTHATEGARPPPCVTAMSTSPTVLEWINQGLPLEPALPLRAFLFGTTKLSFLPTAGIFRHVIPPATFFIETLPSIVWRNSRTGWRSLGFTGLSLYDVSIFFIKGLQEGAITTRASSLAFNFFLAFFPSIIVFFTLIPYIPIDGFQQTLMEIISNVLPPSTNSATFSTLEDIINNQRGGLLSIGFILALYFSTNGMSSLIQAFNSSYHIRENESIIKHQMLSILLTIVISALVFLTIILIIFGKAAIIYMIDYQLINENKLVLLNAAKWVILILMLFLGITTIFNLGPAIKSQIKIFSPGAILATLFIILTSIVFSYYIDNFSQYNKIYGSIGTLIIILLWIYFNAIFLLIGFELNASIFNAKKNLTDKL